MLSIARLTSVLLALLFVTATATLDIRPHAGGLTASLQSGPTAELEDGPEGEEAPVAVFARSFDGDDQIGPDPLGAQPIRVSYELVAPDRGHSPAKPSHPPYAGFPTGPPET